MPSQANPTKRDVSPKADREGSEPVQVRTALFGEFRGAFADVVEPCAELDHHTPASANAR
ncbi:hypothetical protein EAO76_24785 [Streptomyces sp. sk2.1]|nr:hypothetical protein EAO76_24785 [Streptomyces sp. sk2.1]